MYLWPFSRKRQKTDWHDEVVTVAVLALQAGIDSPLHTMVTSHYFRGHAVPRHEDDWHPPTIRTELKRLSRMEPKRVARAARSALRRLP